NINSNNTLSILVWNLQIFGDSKASNEELMNKYYLTMNGHDIIIVQEIRDSDGSAFIELCSMFEDENYECEISSRAGRSVSKEQYGIIYKNYISLDELVDYNPDELDRWERPPIRMDFSIANSMANYSFSIYTIHTKPEDARAEMIALENQINEDISLGLDTNIIIVGDLNADCSYYDEDNRHFDENDGWNWIIENDADTTVSNSNCAYDRIIMNDNAFEEYIYYNINKDVTSDISDHYPVQFLIKI
ncbi:MAG TPA: endonuclease/exonuclease/phosphatase family protein, partial [Allocoleopsis sp.]